MLRRREALVFMAGGALSACSSTRRLNPFRLGPRYRWVAMRLGGKKTGDVVVELSDRAPEHAQNFSRLVSARFYEGLGIHRLVDGRFIQTGDPLSRKASTRAIGTGGPGFTLPPEVGLKHVRGAVAMSRLSDAVNPGQRSNGSQFFFVLKDSPELDGRNTVFGAVVSGLEFLDGLATLPVNGSGAPMERLWIRHIRGSEVSAEDALHQL
jgi:cyclophilin family peptidyl-prolyl cis-trans isomerase